MAQLLIGHLDDFVITVREGFCAKACPKVRSIKLLGHLDRHVEIAALDRELVPGLGILYELQGDFGVAFLLQVRDDALAHETRILDDLQHLLIIALDERQLESIFCRVDIQDFGLSGSVKTVYASCPNFHEVDRLIQSSHDAIVAVQ